MSSIFTFSRAAIHGKENCTYGGDRCQNQRDHPAKFPTKSTKKNNKHYIL